jgi:hypothetical protein
MNELSGRRQPSSSQRRVATLAALRAEAQSSDG